MFIIIDYGEHSTRNIQRRLWELDVESIIVDPDIKRPEITFNAVILAGGPDHVYKEGSRQLPEWFDTIDVPILGICYGMQLLVDRLGGTVEKMDRPEVGPTIIHLTGNRSKLMESVDTNFVYMNHYDSVTDLPDSLYTTSLSQNGHISSVEDGVKYWGIQFHPEVFDTECNRRLFQNFVEIVK